MQRNGQPNGAVGWAHWRDENESQTIIIELQCFEENECRTVKKKKRNHCIVGKSEQQKGESCE
jgi:hypothetical protein